MSKLESVVSRSEQKLASEIERLRRENVRLAAMAYRDELTGLRNRRHFTERLAEEISRSRRHDTAFSIISVDVNDFKTLNDSRGHAAGDLALARVARFLVLMTRAEDVCCRVGGDEFIILLPDTNTEQCACAIRRMRERMHILTDVGLSPRGLALGYATWLATDDEEAILARADRQMYDDKREGHEVASVVGATDIQAHPTSPANLSSRRRRDVKLRIDVDAEPQSAV